MLVTKVHLADKHYFRCKFNFLQSHASKRFSTTRSMQNRIFCTIYRFDRLFHHEAALSKTRPSENNRITADASQDVWRVTATLDFLFRIT